MKIIAFSTASLFLYNRVVACVLSLLLSPRMQRCVPATLLTARHRFDLSSIGHIGEGMGEYDVDSSDTTGDFGGLDDDLKDSRRNDDSTSTVSKARWKRKRYLMIQDCRKELNSNPKKAIRQAEEMIQRWLKIYESSGFEDCYQPTAEAFNVWMHAIAKSNDPDSGFKAEAILKSEMTKRARVQPNVASFTICLDAYARQSRRDPNAANRAERLLFELIRLTEEGRSDLKVTSVTCDTVINAWTQQGTWEGAQRAEQILHRMEELSSQSIQPTAHSYAN
jgi:hypothetical protein